MDIKTLVESDWVAQMLATAPAEIAALSIHPSVDSDARQLPAVIITADARPLIPTNHTYELTVDVILETQSDDTTAATAKAFSQNLIDYLTSMDFLQDLTVRSANWLPISLNPSSTDSTNTEDRRFIQRSQYRLIAQG